MKLIEGRLPNVYLASSVAKSIEDSACYIKNKGFNDQYYKDLIVEYLKEYEKAKKHIRNLLRDKLPDVLSDKQKEKKIGNLLAALKKSAIITTDDENHQKSSWILCDLGKVRQCLGKNCRLVRQCRTYWEQMWETPNGWNCVNG